MKWISTPQIKNLVKKLEFLLPENFDYKAYIDMHPDLIDAKIDNLQKAKEHYLLFGRKECRQYSAVVPTLDVKNIHEEWKDTKNIMVFSPAAPDFDRSSGGNRLYEILKILKKLGYKTYFFCNNPIDRKYIKATQELCETFFSPDIHNNIFMDKYINYLKNCDIHFDNAIFCWYDMGNQYINIVKHHYPDIKIIVDSVDVHWIREQRGCDSSELHISQKTLDHRKNIEKNVYLSSNVIWAITNDDKDHLEKELGDKLNIKILSNIHHIKSGKLGHNIFFIGNYAHNPNIQGAIESIEIFQTFLKTSTYKKLKNKPSLLIAGPNIDDTIINRIKTDKIKVLGHVKDLEDLYRESCLCLSPLYWGAGIKGKICDSGMRGIPILTTDIGNEGIHFKHKLNGLIANNRAQFVNNLEYFFTLSNKEKKQLGDNGKRHLNTIVGLDSAISCIKHTLSSKHVVLSIVAYSQTEKLYKCLDTILSKTLYTNYTIVIHDNSSNIEIYNIIKSFIDKYPNKIDYRKNKINEFFILPNNKIIRDPKYKNSDIVLLNDDIEIISGDWLNHLYSTAYSSHNIAAVGGKTLYSNMKIAEAGAELYNDGTGKNFGRNCDANDPEHNKRKRVGYCSGCLLFMKRDAINIVGCLDESLEKMYYEDSEWQYRAHTLGFTTIYEPRCVVIHNEGSSSGNDTTKGTKRYQAINQKIFVEKYKNSNIEQYN